MHMNVLLSSAPAEAVQRCRTARAAGLFFLLGVFTFISAGCQSSRAQRGEYPRDATMTAPDQVREAGMVHDRTGYTRFDP